MSKPDALSTVQGHLHDGTSRGAEARAELGGASVEQLAGGLEVTSEPFYPSIIAVYN